MQMSESCTRGRDGRRFTLGRRESGRDKNIGERITWKKGKIMGGNYGKKANNKE